MKEAHINPEEAVKLHQQLNIKHSIAIHHATFQLTAEAIDAPFHDLQQALKKANLSSANFTVPEFGTENLYDTQHKILTAAPSLY